MARTVTLWHQCDELGSRILDATLETNGDLRIDGQDLGNGVEEIFG